MLSHDDVLQACVRHWPKLVHICFGILRNREDAEDAASQAVLKALVRAPAEFTTSPAAWLTTVGKNEARDLLRRNTNRSEVERAVHTVPEADPVRDARIRHDTGTLFDGITGYLTAGERNALELYVTVAIGSCTQAELAEREAMPLERLRYLCGRVQVAVRDAAVTMRLIADPAAGCGEPARWAQGRSPSAELRRKVTRHMADCEPCRGERTALAGRFLAIPGAALLATFLERLSRPKQVAAMTTAAVLLGVGIVGTVAIDPAPEPVPAAPAAPVWVPATTGVIPTTTAFATTTATSTTTSSSPPAPTSSPTATATTTPAAAPSPTTTPTTTTTGGGGRTEEPPVIRWARLEHERIVATHRTGCDEPTRSRVDAAVTGAVSVRLRTVVDGQTAEVEMSRAGDVWRNVVGPYARAGQKVEVHVVATSASGAEVTHRAGAVCVTSCHRSTEERRQ